MNINHSDYLNSTILNLPIDCCIHISANNNQLAFLPFQSEYLLTERHLNLRKKVAILFSTKRNTKENFMYK